MKTSADPVRHYLNAVEREASALPADRRQELLADLAEHIEVTRAERPDATIGEVLAELGDPRAIAATALAEAGGPVLAAPAAVGTTARRGKVHPLVPLLLITLSLPFTMVFPHHLGPLVGVLARIIGAVLLCTSVYWSAAQKTTGVLLAVGLPTVIFTVVNQSGDGPAPGTETLLAHLAMLTLIAGTAAWLWRARRRA